MAGRTFSAKKIQFDFIVNIMKISDILIYIFLICCGVILGWFLKDTLSPPEKPFSDSESKSNKSFESDVLPNQPMPTPNPISISENKNVITNLPPESNENPEIQNTKIQIQETPKIEIQQNEIREIQKSLNRNDFFAAIKLLANLKSKDENSNNYTEALNLITNFVQIKTSNLERQNILADIEKSLGFYPGWWPLIVLKGKVYAAMGEFEAGAKNLKGEMFYINNEKELAELLSFIRMLRAKRIEQLKQQKLSERLIGYYEEIILEDSAYAQYYFELGRLYAEKHDYYSALVMLGIIVADETYGKDASELISQIIAIQELEAAKQLVKFENKNANEIPIVRLNDRIFAFVHLNDKIEAKFLIDTGATISHISFNMASKLGFTGSQLKDLRWFQTAGGLIKQPVVRLNSLTIANVKMMEIMVAVSKETGKEFDGLLGMNFLGRFNFEINLERNLLILRQK